MIGSLDNVERTNAEAKHSSHGRMYIVFLWGQVKMIGMAEPCVHGRY